MLLPVLALSMAGCDRDILDNAAVDDNCQKATFYFTPDFAGAGSASTKSLAEQPEVKNIFFAVFDAAGFKLSEYAEAVPNTLADENGKLFLYSVELTVTDQPRVVHIIANAPEKIKFGSETEVIGTLVTQYDAAETGVFDRKDAYWQRVYLEKGVCAAPKAELKTTNPTAYNAQLETYQSIVNAFDGVKLIRNFAQLTVTEKAANFEMTGFWITNYPEKGSVAPYNRITGQFQSDYAEYDNISDLMNAGEGNYKGYSPVSTRLVSISGKNSTELTALKIPMGTDGQGHTFCYEREVPKKDPLYIIVAGNYNGGSETYYKIDLRDNNGEYFPILRNFNYRISINNVYRAGASSVQGALASAPSGNIDSSIDMQGLDNISDGVAQIYVGETDVVLVGNGNVQLRYKFIPDVTNPASSANTTTAPASESDHTPYVTFTTSYGSTGAVFDQTDANAVKEVVASDDEADGYRVVTLTSVAPTEVVKNQEITITGHYWAENKWQTISRTVSYHLRNKLDMTVSCNPGKVPRGTGEEFDLIIGLEAGLPSSIFSLDMDIEARNLSITTNNDPLPLSSGLSYITGKTNLPSFYFTKTITWTDYQEAEVVDGYKYFTCHFKTNKGLEDGDDIYVSNKYFNQENVHYATYLARKFSNVSFDSDVTKTGETVGFSYDLEVGKLPKDSKVIVGLAGFEEAPSVTSGYQRKLSYIGIKTDTYGGTDAVKYELYEMPVSQVSNTLSLMPFRTGYGYVKLWADEYIAYEKRASIVQGSIVWSNASVSLEPVAPADWNLTGSGQPFATQTFNFVFTAKVPVGVTVTDATVNGISATSAVVNGEDLTIRLNNTFAPTGGTSVWTVNADLNLYSNSYDQNLTVWNISQFERGTEITTTSVLKDSPYVMFRFEKNGKIRHVQNDGNHHLQLGDYTSDHKSAEYLDYVWKLSDVSINGNSVQGYMMNVKTKDYVTDISETDTNFPNHSGAPHTPVVTSGTQKDKIAIEPNSSSGSSGNMYLKNNYSGKYLGYNGSDIVLSSSNKQPIQEFRLDGSRFSIQVNGWWLAAGASGFKFVNDIYTGGQGRGYFYRLEGGNNVSLVTESNDLSVGNQYIIVYHYNNTYMALGAETYTSGSGIRAQSLNLGNINTADGLEREIESRLSNQNDDLWKCVYTIEDGVTVSDWKITSVATSKVFNDAFDDVVSLDWYGSNPAPFKVYKCNVLQCTAP